MLAVSYNYGSRPAANVLNYLVQSVPFCFILILFFYLHVPATHPVSVLHAVSSRSALCVMLLLLIQLLGSALHKYNIEQCN